MTGRKLGQHFLKDHSIAKRIIELSYIKPGVTVVEVGPRMGGADRLACRVLGATVAYRKR